MSGSWTVSEMKAFRQPLETSGRDDIIEGSFSIVKPTEATRKLLEDHTGAVPQLKEVADEV